MAILSSRDALHCRDILLRAHRILVRASRVALKEPAGNYLRPQHKPPLALVLCPTKAVPRAVRLAPRATPLGPSARQTARCAAGLRASRRVSRVAPMDILRGKAEVRVVEAPQRGQQFVDFDHTGQEGGEDRLQPRVWVTSTGCIRVAGCAHCHRFGLKRFAWSERSRSSPSARRCARCTRRNLRALSWPGNGGRAA